MFTNEYEYLIHLIKSAIRDEQPEEKPEALSFEKVFELGKLHEVTNIVFIAVEKLKNKPDEALFAKWKMYYAFSLQRHAHQMTARRAIVSALNEANIRSVEVQGTVMKTLYPYPHWRMMSDIDFIVDVCALEHIETILQQLGYKTVMYSGEEVDAFGPNGIAVEMHTDFFNERSAYYGVMGDPFSRSHKTDDGVTYQADTTDFFLYNILHCIKHYVNRGAGIRRVLDIYFMDKELSNKVDMGYINSVLEHVQCMHLYEELRNLALEWFGDVSNGQAVLESTKQQVYLSGTHGSPQIQLKNEYANASDTEKRHFKLKKYWSLLFPSKENIYNAYPVCAERHYPAMFCWIYRWIKIVGNTKKRNRAVQRMQDIKNTKLK